MKGKKNVQHINNGLDNNSQILSDSEKIELLSEDVQEIMGKPPHWIVKWGITVIFSIVVLVFMGSFMFKYPDVINASVLILSENPPVVIYAHSTGKIDQLLVQNEQIVSPGDYLAIIENTANYKHVTELSLELKLLEAQLISQNFSEFSAIPNHFVLGSIQASFSHFQRNYYEFSNYMEANIIENKISSIKRQIRDYEIYMEKLGNQITNHDLIVDLSYRQFHRDSTLFVTGVIAASQLETSEKEYIRNKNDYQSLLANLANTRMTVNKLKFDIVDLKGQQLDQTGTMINMLKEAYENLLTNISKWEKQYVLVSPIHGKITFTDFWSENQFVTTNDRVFSVIPVVPQNIIGRMKYSTIGAGKVNTGMPVLIQLEHYPHMEYGVLHGTITSISLMPQPSQEGTFYTAQISLDNGLTTNYGTTLFFNQEMHGQAQIITKKISVFERLVGPLKYAFKRAL